MWFSNHASDCFVICYESNLIIPFKLIFIYATAFGNLRQQQFPFSKRLLLVLNAFVVNFVKEFRQWVWPATTGHLTLTLALRCPEIWMCLVIWTFLDGDVTLTRRRDGLNVLYMLLNRTARQHMCDCSQDGEIQVYFWNIERLVFLLKDIKVFNVCVTFQTPGGSLRSVFPQLKRWFSVYANI